MIAYCAETEGMAGASHAARVALRVMDRALMRLASVVVLGTIMSILDTTIVNVAIETLGRRPRRVAVVDPVGRRRATCSRWRP